MLRAGRLLPKVASNLAQLEGGHEYACAVKNINIHETDTTSLHVYLWPLSAQLEPTAFK